MNGYMRQAGQTLIGMMVGLLLSLMGIVAIFALYKAVGDVSVDATLSSQRDGQLVAGLLGAQAELQQAGWRIEPGTPGSSVELRDGGRQVVWRFRQADGAPLSCAGLRLVDDVGQAQPRGLYLLPATACSGVDDAGLTWGVPGQPVPQMLLSEAAFHVGEDEAAVLPLELARFHLAQAPCVPWRQGVATTEHTRLALDVAGQELFAVCLSNVDGAPLAVPGDDDVSQLEEPK